LSLGKILTEYPTNIETKFLENQNSICSKPMKETIKIISESVGYAKLVLVPKSPSCSESATESPCLVLPNLPSLHPQSLKSLHIFSNPFGLSGSTRKTSSRKF